MIVWIKYSGKNTAGKRDKECRFGRLEVFLNSQRMTHVGERVNQLCTQGKNIRGRGTALGGECAGMEASVAGEVSRETGVGAGAEVDVGSCLVSDCRTSAFTLVREEATRGL